MRSAMLLLLPVVMAASLAERRPEPTRCTAGADKAKGPSGAAARARPLNEMPDARPVLSVWRQVDGCAVLLVRENGRIVEEPVGRPEQRRVFRP